MRNDRRFAATILVSTLVMLGLMDLNTDTLGPVFFSQTRAWMALSMGAAMATVMLAFMLGMHQEHTDTIILAQCRKIKEMKWLIQGTDKKGKALTADAAAARPMPFFETKPGDEQGANHRVAPHRHA